MTPQHIQVAPPGFHSPIQPTGRPAIESIMNEAILLSIDERLQMLNNRVKTLEDELKELKNTLT
jgi:hypothetical protein